MQASRKKPGMKMLEKSSETLNCSKPRSPSLDKEEGRKEGSSESLGQTEPILTRQVNLCAIAY